MKNLRPKLIAFSIHLLISIIVIGLFLIIATQFWYPATLFNLENTWQALKILLPVDAILGPLLTLLLYIPGKKNLKLDLSIIAIIQLSALLYGAQVIYNQRPVIFTFDVKEFEIITAAELNQEKIPAENKLVKQPQQILISYALPPQNEEEVMHFLLNSITYQKDPARLYPVDDYTHIIKKAAINITTIKSSQVTEIKKLKSLQQQIDKNQNIHLFPLKGSLGDYTYVAIDLSKSKIIDYINIDMMKNNSK